MKAARVAAWEGRSAHSKAMQIVVFRSAAGALAASAIADAQQHECAIADGDISAVANPKCGLLTRSLFPERRDGAVKNNLSPFHNP